MSHLSSMLVFCVAVSGCTFGLSNTSNPTPSIMRSFELGLVAGDMVEVMKADWPAALTHIFVESPASKTLDNVLRRAGYAVEPAADPENIPIRFNLRRLGDLNWHQATLTVNNSWSLTRFYKRTRGRLVPASGFTLGGGRGVKGPVDGQSYRIEDNDILAVEKPAEYWFINAIETIDPIILDNAEKKITKLGHRIGRLPALNGEARILRVGPFVRSNAARDALGQLRAQGFEDAVLVATKESPITRPREDGLPGVPDTPRPCSRMTINVGSLRASIENLLGECGYAIGKWNLGTGDNAHDWVIKTAFSVTVDTGVWGLLDLLTNTYGIEGTVRRLGGKVDFKEAN